MYLMFAYRWITSTVTDVGMSVLLMIIVLLSPVSVTLSMIAGDLHTQKRSFVCQLTARSEIDQSQMALTNTRLSVMEVMTNVR